MWPMDNRTCGSVHTNYCGENCEAPHWYLVCCSRLPQLWHVTQTQTQGEKTRRYKSKMLNINKVLPINVLNVRHVTHQNLIAPCFCKKPQRSRCSCTGVFLGNKSKVGKVRHLFTDTSRIWVGRSDLVTLSCALRWPCPAVPASTSDLLQSVGKNVCAYAKPKQIKLSICHEQQGML